MAGVLTAGLLMANRLLAGPLMAPADDGQYLDASGVLVTAGLVATPPRTPAADAPSPALPAESGTPFDDASRSTGFSSTPVDLAA